MVDAALLEQAVEDAKRVQDHQVEEAQRFDDRTHSLMGLSLAAIAGGFALATFLLAHGTGLAPILLAASGIVAGFGSLAFFVQSSAGLWSEHRYEVSPDPASSKDYVEGEGASLKEYRKELLDAIVDAVAGTERMMVRVHAARRAGLLLLVTSAALYVLSGGAFLLSTLAAG